MSQESSPRILLRAVEMEDLENRRRWLNDPQVNQYLWQGQRLPLSREQAREELRQIVTGESNRLELVIELPDGSPVGFVALGHVDYQNGKAELSIVIGERKAWGRGCGTEAVRQALDFAFFNLRLNKVWLQVDAGHSKAIQAYVRLGFSEEGRLRDDWFRRGTFADTVVMSVLAREWGSGREAGDLLSPNRQPIA